MKRRIWEKVDVLVIIDRKEMAEGKGVKKKEVKGILKEIVEICYAKEDKRREDTFKKELKK